MDVINNCLFLLVVAFIFNHELDAIKKKEWRFFFAFTPLSDDRAYQLFTGIHIPLFLLILSNLSSSGFQTGFDLFVIAHAGVHWLLRNHRLVHFNDTFSGIWIFGGALIAAVHLLTI